MADAVKEPKEKAPDGTEVKTFTQEELETLVTGSAEKVVKEAIESLKKATHDAARKQVFPSVDSDTGEMEGLEGEKSSVIDTRFFFKNFASGRVAGAREDGLMMAKQLSGSGGPFKRLSPTMEMFAQGIKSKWNPQTCGFTYQDYKEKVDAEYKAASGMSEGVAADGGVTVPIEFYTTMIEFAVTQSPILSKVWRIPMGSNQMRFSRLVQAAGSYFGGIQLNWIEEADTKEDTKPAMEQITLNPKKLIGLVYLTDELIADSYLNIVNYVTGLFTRAFQYEMERVIIAGNMISPHTHFTLDIQSTIKVFL